MKRKVRNLRVKCEHDFIRFHRYFPQCRVPTIDIGLFRGGQSPRLLEIKLCPFWFPRKIQKGRWIFIEFSENYHFKPAGIFEAQKPRESRLFLFSKRALDVSTRFQAVLLFQGGRLFSFSHTIIPCLKRHRRKWRSKVKNPNQANPKSNRTRPEYRSHTGPPAQIEKPVCTASPLCEGCPFPGHGFLCQGEDGECMRTRLMKLSEKEGPKWICHFPAAVRWNSLGAVIHPAHELCYTELQLKSLKKILIARRARSSYETCFLISFLINHKTGSAIRRCLPD